jgi:phosphoglycerate kinase
VLKHLTDLKREDLNGKKVIVRVDFNVPIEEGKVNNDYRIQRALPTIKFLKENGAKIMLISHIETKGVDHPTLKPVFEYFGEKMPELGITFLPSFFGDEATKKLNDMKEGEIVLFENIRQYEEEKENNEAFSKSIASLGDLYVNDAFAVSHRSHASVVGIPKFLPAYAGILLGEEIKNLNVAENIERPFLFILGGAKFETKLPLITKFLDLADHVFIGGALANDLLKAKGKDIKKSLISLSRFRLDDLIHNLKLIVPMDEIWQNDSIVDVGPKSIEEVGEIIQNAKYILWNGPMGNFELGFKESTIALAEKIGASGAHSVVGGGDTLAAIQELNLLDKFSFVSTGGGARLDYLSDGTLVGIKALEGGL